jgi:hypothetical protein
MNQSGNLYTVCSPSHRAALPLPALTQALHSLQHIVRPQSLLRSSDTLDQAVALFDTSLDGWALRYANDAWAHAIMSSQGSQWGSGDEASPSLDSSEDLNPTLATPTLTFWELFGLVSDRSMPDLTAALAARQPVELEVALNKGGHASLDCSDRRRISMDSVLATPAAGPRFRVILKPAGEDSLAPGIPVGVPSYICSSTFAMRSSTSSQASSTISSLSMSTAGGLWFAVAQRISSPAVGGGAATTAAEAPSKAPAEAQPSKTLATMRTGERSTASADVLASKVTAAANRAAAAFEEAAASSASSFGLPFPKKLSGILLGPMLGSGSMGRVYRGTWHGKLVAVKVLGAHAGAADVAASGVMEGVLGAGLQHPNIVPTLDYALQEVHSEEGRGEDGGTRVCACLHPWMHEIRWDAMGRLRCGYACVQVRGEGAGTEADGCLYQVWLIQKFCNRGRLYDAVER